MRRLEVVGLAIFLSLTLLASLALANTAIRIGINYPLTGPYSVEGLDEIRAARMAVDEVNRNGGILGRRVQLLSRNSASDVHQTVVNVNDLIDEGCAMVFGGSSSAVAIASAEVAQQRNAIFFGTLTYSTATTLEGAQKNSFRESNNSWMSANAMADWLNKHYAGKTYFFITADYTWGWTTEGSLRDVIGATNRTTHGGIMTPLGTIDFSRALERVREVKPDVLVLVLFGKDLAYALSLAAEMGLNKSTQIVVPNLTLGMAERTGLAALEGVVGTVPWTWKIPYIYGYPRGKRFVEEFVKRYRRYPSSAGGSAYTIVHEYKAAVERAGTFETAKVVEALEGHRYSHLKDEQWWRPLDHQSVQTVYMVRGNDLDTILADPLRMDFFNVLSSKSGEETVRTPEEWKRLRREAGLPEYLVPPVIDKTGGVQ